MISVLKGILAEKWTDAVVVECGGVGYYVRTPYNVSAALPEIGLAILGSFSPGQLYRAIAENNDTAIAKVKGVGKKTAQRIVLELKEKIKTLAQEELPESFKDSRASAAVNHSTQMAIAALVSLGFKRKESENAVNQVDPAQTVEQIISVALRKHLS